MSIYASIVDALEGLLPAALGGHGGLKVEGVASGTPVPVSGTVTVDTSALATASKQDTGNGLLALLTGVCQVETATVAGTIGSSGAGNATVVVTAAAMSNSPKTIAVAVANDDTGAQVATKIRAALLADVDVSAFFTIGGTALIITLTALAVAPNDATMNISIANGTCSGLTSAPTSVNTTAGVPSLLSVYTDPLAGVWDLVKKALRISQTAATMPAATTMQSTISANANGTSLNVQGFVTAIINIAAGVAMSGGTDIAFEASVDDSEWTAIMAHQIGVSGSQVLTTSAIGDYRLNVAGFKSVRARIENYSAGTVTVKGYVTPLSAHPSTVNLSYISKVPTSYRSAVVAADVMAVPGTVTCTLINGVGALSAGTYYVKVVAGNIYGRTTGKAGDVTVVTSGANLCVKAAFAAVTGATFYDIYCSTDADPKFVGRITEAQRASGIIIDTHNHTAAGGAINSVYIYPVGTGLQSLNTAATNNGYIVPATVDCTGFQYADFDLTFSRTGDDVAPSLTVTPFFYNSRTATYRQGAIQTLQFGGTSGAYGAMPERVRVEVRGNTAVALAVAAIAGTGASLDIDCVLS